ncbi:ABC transporter permease [Pelagerythrobacter sp.]|uniref:ABC transporter permease n=1 Tax=Pelagerythrobacter sp. TaxID=2800702 RepID=UPI0035B17F05
MNRFALLSLYRSLTRHKLYAALNIGGLGLGIAVFLVLGLYVRFETSFEEWLPDSDEIYVVQTEWKAPGQPFTGRFHWTMGGLLDQLREDFPGLVGARIQGNGAIVLRDGNAVAEDAARVDETFFDVFDLPMVAGQGRGALSDPGNILLSEATARRYFGDGEAVGRSMTLTTDGETRAYRVAGVFADLPANTDLEFTILTRMPDQVDTQYWYNWGSTSVQTFVRFPAREAADALDEQMPGFVARRGAASFGDNANEDMGINLLPLESMHLTPEGRESASRKLTVTTLGLVGLLTLLIAIVNYVNLATSRAALRAREVAMRKVLGADRRALIRQFLTEATATAALAALIGLILAEVSLPLINAAGGLELSITYLGTGGVILPLALLVLIVGLIAGAYPAFMLSGYRAAAVLASTRSPGGGRAGTRVRQALVVFQFALAIAFMIGTAVLFAQTQHLRNADLGYQRDGLLLVRSLAWAEDPALRRSLLRGFAEIPSVRSVTVSDSVAGGTGYNNVDSFGTDSEPPISMRRVATGPDFFETYGTRVLAGRPFGSAQRMDDSTDLEWEEPRNILVNRTLARTLGYDDPAEAVGQQLGHGAPPRTIVGVVEDMRFLSPREPLDPTYYTYYSEEVDVPVATLRFSGDPRAVIKAAQAVWQRTAPQAPFEAETGVQSLQQFYEADDRAMRLFAIGAGLAVLIGVVGLWGLASFNTARRVKEIGVRKSLGASAGDIVKLLVGQFLRPVVIANLIAWPLAFFAMQRWLAGFADRIALSPVYFIGASLLAVAIAVLTVLGQSLRASRTAPAWALHHD